VLQELAGITEGKLCQLEHNGMLIEELDIPDERECFFSIDSRTIQPGQVFIALRGSSTDGHNYLESALQKGACGFIVSDIKRIPKLETRNSKLETQDLPFVIQVHDTLKALQSIACACRQQHQIPLAAITGSNGKTTVKDMTASILATHHHILKAQKSFNNLIGLPLTLAKLPDQTLASLPILLRPILDFSIL
jgi:UDP-N-acetylmuramoyl-tripeptide--D-alanyl-D-alanine ligase